ncbi:uncharacterized protein At4g15970-like [Diospyros lotus]|uniref:uncharacterized protein At4g15970-like n=1 Tax=Diospyros lotus TaxID=55363 RepID=UPI0022504E88|nr:uncharacterized protein At4g15970-like [Diospyros lotus]
MGDRTVVLTILSPEWARPGSVFDLFLESFRFGQGTKPFLNNLVVFTVDGQSLQYCKSIHPYCFSLANHGFNYAAWKPFRDLQHLTLGWKKDADVMWFRNPFQHFHRNFEMIVAQDSCSDTLENKSSKTDGGFFFLKANEISL